MSQIRNIDVLLEVIDLACEIVGDATQQLGYFRASVYKDETADHIRDRIQNLRFLALLFHDELMQEPFADYDAEINNSVNDYTPGECSFSSRTSRLLLALKTAFEQKKLSIGSRRLKLRESNDHLVQDIRNKRDRIVSICSHGSQHRTFFLKI